MEKGVILPNANASVYIPCIYLVLTTGCESLNSQSPVVEPIGIVLIKFTLYQHNGSFVKWFPSPELFS